MRVEVATNMARTPLIFASLLPPTLILTPPMNPLREGLWRQRVPEPCVLVISGATGDLAHRKLMPAIYSLAHEGLLPPHFSIIGASLPEMSDQAFRDDMKKAVVEFCRYKPINEAV